MRCGTCIRATLALIAAFALIYSEMLYLSSPLMLGFNAPAAMPQVRTARTQKQGATSCFIEIRRSRFAELP